jgi:Sulfotransferase family
MAQVHGRLVAEMVLEQQENAPPLWQHAHYPMGVRGLNRVGRWLGRCGVRWPDLDPESMMATARRRAGLNDFGDPLFREGLEVLVESFERNAAVHQFGRHFFREYCVGLLVNRLKIQDELTRHPEIHSVAIERPLVITGLPRSGTTFLHRLMSEDPAGRTLLFWETFEPAPAPRAENYRTDPRIGRAQKAVDLINRLSPRIPAAHHFAAAEAEECNNLFAHEFRAGMIGFMFDAPEYMRWLDAQDRVPGYRSMRTQLQLLSLNVRGDYWVLKAPAHLFGLDALLTVYPDANIVQTHRDPKRVIPSVASLAAGFRSLVADPLDLRRLGAEFVEAMAEGPEQAMKARESADPDRFLDVRYESLIADPIGTVREVCRHFGYAFTPEYEARTRRYLAANPQHKHGVHSYSLDDFGLDAATVDHYFADYNAWLEEHVPRTRRI